MWAVSLLLPALAVGLISDYFTVQEGSFTNTAFSSHQAANLQQCATRCGRLQPEYCDGLRYGPDGLCELLVDPDHCLITEPPLDDKTVSYSRGAVTRVTDFCAPNWIAFNGSCYLRSTVRNKRGPWNKGCPTSCSNPVSINHDLEMTFLLHHSSRPSKAEWIGPIKKTDADGVNPDGSDFTSSLPISSSKGTCYSLPNERVSDQINRGSCGQVLGAICESRQPPGLLSGCPAGWLQTADHCYLFVSQPLAFHAADEYCGQLADGARLGHPSEAGMTAILAAFVRQAGITDNFWIGVHDETSEGTWESLDDSPFYLDWNFSGIHLEHNTSLNCAKIKASNALGGIKPCDLALPFLCHLPSSQP